VGLYAQKWHRILRTRSTGVFTDAFVTDACIPSFACGWGDFAYLPISIISGSVQQVRVRFSLGAADPVNFGANRPGFQMGIPAGAETVVRNIATVPGVPGAASGNIHGNQRMILPPVVAVFVTTAGDPLVNVVWELWATMTLEFLP